jgi:O-antigen ligase
MAALWIAPDKSSALLAAALLLAGLFGAWLLAWAGRQRRTRAAVLGGVGLAATALAAALALYALCVGTLDSDGDGAAVNANVLAAGLLVLLALGATGGLWVRTRLIATRRWAAWAAAGGWSVLWLAGALALVATSSRGAWVAALVAILVATMWALRPWAQRRLRGAGALLDSVLLLLAVAAATGWLLLLRQPAGQPLLAGDRVALWRDGLALLGDAPFTGTGLHSTMMALSTYVYLLHVGYISHVHNLFLAITVEQGLIGLIAWGCLVLTAAGALVQARRRQVVPVAMQAALVGALAALLVHGLVDAGLYASRLSSLLFLPIGAAWAAGGTTHGAGLEARSRRLMGALAPLAAVALLFAWPGSRAAWQTNLGAVAQTQAELFLYTWPEWSSQDALRRSAAVDLAPAIARYQAALALDPAQPAANRRLGQIVISQGDRAQAQRLLEAAYAGDPHHPATRLLLGELYALAGEPMRAAEMWHSLDLHRGQLDVRRAWLAESGAPADVAAFDAAVAALARD